MTTQNPPQQILIHAQCDVQEDDAGNPYHIAEMRKVVSGEATPYFYSETNVETGEREVYDAATMEEPVDATAADRYAEEWHREYGDYVDWQERPDMLADLRRTVKRRLRTEGGYSEDDLDAMTTAAAKHLLESDEPAVPSSGEGPVVASDTATMPTEATIPQEYAITGDTEAVSAPPVPKPRRERKPVSQETVAGDPADPDPLPDIPLDAPITPPASAPAVRAKRGDAPPSRPAPSGDAIGDLLDRLKGKDRQILERVLADRDKGEASNADVKEIAAMLAKRNPPNASRISGAAVPIRERRDALGLLTKEQAHVRATTNFTADELATVNDLYRAERDAIEVGIETTDIRRDRQRIIDDARKRGGKEPSDRALAAALRERARTVGGRGGRSKDKDLRSSPAAVGNVSVIVRH